MIEKIKTIFICVLLLICSITTFPAYKFYHAKIVEETYVISQKAHKWAIAQKEKQEKEFSLPDYDYKGLEMKLAQSENK